MLSSTTVSSRVIVGSRRGDLLNNRRGEGLVGVGGITSMLSSSTVSFGVIVGCRRGDLLNSR